MRSSEECFLFLLFFPFFFSALCLVLRCIALHWIDDMSSMMSLVFWSRHFIDMRFSIYSHLWLINTFCRLDFLHVPLAFDVYTLYNARTTFLNGKWFTQLSYRHRQLIPIYYLRYAYNFALQFSKQTDQKNRFFLWSALPVSQSLLIVYHKVAFLLCVSTTSLLLFWSLVLVLYSGFTPHCKLYKQRFAFDLAFLARWKIIIYRIHTHIHNDKSSSK